MFPSREATAAALIRAAGLHTLSSAAAGGVRWRLLVCGKCKPASRFWRPDSTGTFDFTATTFDASANPDFALTGTPFFTGELVLHTNHGVLIFKDAGAAAVDGDVLRSRASGLDRK